MIIPPVADRWRLRMGKIILDIIHIHVDEETGQDMYMAGAYHTDEDHDILTIKANRIIVPIGDIRDYSTSSTGFTDSDSQPFLIEKYTNINGEKRSPSGCV